MPDVRAALYARFSSELQSERSAAEQLDRCARYCAERDWTVVERHSDDAVSGATQERPGLDALLAACHAGRVDAVVVEDLSRLTRNAGDAHRMREALDYIDVRIIGIADGVDTAARGARLLYSVRASMSEEYRHDLADKTRRGMRAAAERGLATGGLAYGYASSATGDGHRAITIVPERAEVVRRIFAAYAAGQSYATIAATLNADGVPSPRAHPRRRGRGWVATAVRSLLLNPRYIGRWSWGAREWRRDPETRARTPRMRPAATVTSERPDLAIVDPDTWRAVEDRIRGRIAPERGRRTEYPLSGLLVCGSCGAPLVIHGGGGPGRRYYRCADARSRGTCGGGSLREDAARSALLAGLRGTLTSGAVGGVLDVAAEVLAEVEAGAGTERAATVARLRRAEGRVARLVEALASGASGSEAVGRELGRAEGEAREARIALASIDAAAPPPCLPTPAELLAYAVAALDEIACCAPVQARALLRAWLGTVTVHRAPGGYVLRCAVDVLAVAARPHGGGARSIAMVAGARYRGDRAPWAVPMAVRVAA